MDLLRRQGLQKTMRLLLQDRYAPDDPVATQQTQCPQKQFPHLFNCIAPRSEHVYTTTLDDNEPDHGRPHTDEFHTCVNVGKRLTAYHREKFLDLLTAGTKMLQSFQLEQIVVYKSDCNL